MTERVRGEVELCVWSGTGWVEIPNGLSDLRQLLTNALTKLDQHTRIDSITHKVLSRMIIEEINNMPGPEGSE